MNKLHKDSLGDRMKRYENITRNYLISRMPVVIRLDGCHFHTFTRGFEKPFDKLLRMSMTATTKYLINNIQNCVLGYTQSDEISLLLVDYKELNTSAWFDNNIQKICSVSASMCSIYFNNIIRKLPFEFDCEREQKTYTELVESKSLATFDSRVFNLTKEEVCNYFIWRQNDCIRNAISSTAQYHFSHKELQNKSCNDMKDMLLNLKIDINNMPDSCTKGVFITKDNEIQTNDKTPIFKEERDVIERMVYINE